MRVMYSTCLMAICVACNAYAESAQTPQPVYMTSQIQRLLNEKQEKISQLEECDSKRKGFMIAGISTIGLTAVGVGVNIAQASKSNKLSNQIEDQNRELEKQQSNLSNINSKISALQSDQARRDCEQDGTKQWDNGRCVSKTGQSEITDGQPASDVVVTAAPVQEGTPVAETGPTEPKVDISKWTKETYQKCLANFYTGHSIALTSNPSDKVGIRWYWSKSHNGKWCEGYYGGKYFYDYKKNPNPCPKSKFTSLANGEWTITLQNGKTMKGIAMCSNTKGSVRDELRDNIDTSGNGINCWCKLTQTDVSECLATQKFSWIHMGDFGPIDDLDMDDFKVYDEFHNPMPDAYYKLGQSTCPWMCAHECGYQLFDYGGRDRARAMHGVPWIDAYDIDHEAVLNTLREGA